MKKAVLLCAFINSMLFAQNRLPAFHSSHPFYMTQSSSFGSGLYGYWNPALAATLHSPEFTVIWADYDPMAFNHKSRGFFAGTGFVSFGVNNESWEWTHTGEKGRINDYRLALGTGDASFRWGVGYSWISGANTEISQKGFWSAGALARPSRFFSFGLTGQFARGNDSFQGIAELGIRPFGTDRLTLFADMAFQRKDIINGETWSAGLSAQPVDGVYVTGRYFDDKRFMLGVTLDWGNWGVSAATAETSGSGRRGNAIALRIGANKPSAVQEISQKESMYLTLHLKGPLVYRRYQLFDSRVTLMDVIRLCDQAVSDSRVAGIAVNAEGLRVSSQSAWEIRQELQRVRDAGKKVIIYFDRASMASYHLASVADRIIMDPEGMLVINGYALSRTYMKDLLDRLGLGFDEWRFFPYKSALESYNRTDMSKADREQRQDLLNDFYTVFKTDIAESRRLSYDQVDSLVNRPIGFLGIEAKRAGLIDTLARWDAVANIIAKIESVPKKLVSYSELKQDLYDKQWGAEPVIAVVYALGECDLEKGIKGRSLSKTIRSLAAAPNIKALVLRVDSPGGDGLASDLVTEALKFFQKHKPVFVSQGSVAASGGYWLSMSADTILAGPFTVTGSIGVIGGWVWDKGLGDKLGMTSDHVQAGRYADLGLGISLPFINLPVPKRNLTGEERQRMEKLVRTMYQDFMAKVAAGRNMDYKDVRDVAAGRVWSGKAGKNIGLIDEIGGLADAIRMAKKRIGLTESDPVKIIELPSSGLFNPDLFIPKLIDLPTVKNRRPMWQTGLEMLIKQSGRPLYMLPLDWLENEEFEWMFY